MRPALLDGVANVSVVLRSRAGIRKALCDKKTIVYLLISPFSFSLLTRFLLLKINFLFSVKCSQDIGFF